MTRRRLSPKAKAEIFQAAQGCCHICGGKIFKAWHIEHVVPLALGGADEPSNMKPAHPVCHSGKSRTDVAAISKAKRLERRHMGIKKRTGFWKPKGARYDWSAGKWIVERNTP
jgi:5-methylcytosine-specific restriction endonuclease McrA